MIKWDEVIPEVKGLIIKHMTRAAEEVAPEVYDELEGSGPMTGPSYKDVEAAVEGFIYFISGGK